jgi:hypothetical protein
LSLIRSVAVAAVAGAFAVVAPVSVAAGQAAPVWRVSTIAGFGDRATRSCQGPVDRRVGLTAGRRCRVAGRILEYGCALNRATWFPVGR